MRRRWCLRIEERRENLEEMKVKVRVYCTVQARLTAANIEDPPVMVPEN